MFHTRKKALIGFVLLVLFQSATATASNERGLAWLASRVTPEGGAPGRLDANWTALSILAFEQAGSPPVPEVAALTRARFETTAERVFQALGTRDLELLAGLQEPDGSYGSEPALTGWALLAHARAGSGNADAISYLEGRQNPDGSWGGRDSLFQTGLITYA